MQRTRSTLLALALSLLSAAPLAAPLAAQQEGGRREPKRPRLAAGADTADAHAYFAHGLSRLEQQPYEAADAFYWAARLDPTWADPLYARRIALLMSNPRRLESYLDGNRRTVQSPEIRQIDSLQYRALVINPFLYRRLDRQLFKFYIRSSFRRGESMSMRSASERTDEALLEHWIEGYLLNASPWMRGWNSYSAGRFPDALRLYAAALRGSKNKSDIHADRARIFFMTGRVDSAQVQMTQAIEQMRKKDKDDLVFFYESKALYEHSIGMIQEQLKNPAAAREAYARALQEDLSYHPAHTRLALLALAAGDTATALGELDLAVQIQGEDASLRHTYGATLAVMRKLPEAEEQLRRAIALEPYFAAPYHALGRVLDAQGKPEALAQYRAFLERASRRDPQRGWVEQRVAALGGTP
jgi:tetratricopeptide (TPR) repeat protein